MVGKTLLHYQIIEKIGSGAMGEVYRAHDTTLGRDVAIKVLPDAWAQDPERLARFEREARTLASLHHPNVATIFGFHEAESIHFLAMELVEGQDLTQRVARGALPVDDAIDLARQITDGLEAAHERGIVHRDLKPANVKVTRDGRVKILDFGLALAFRGEPGAESTAHSPTLTTALTEAGMILGTAAYMSPEQARGESVDARCDIWAFGAVLYELLTGKGAFRGRTVTDTLAAVLKEDPDRSALPSGTPVGVRRALERCLTKDREQRLHHIADVRLDLMDRGTAAPAISPRAALPIWGWVLIVIGLGAAFLAGSRMLGGDAATTRLPHREFSITVPQLSERDFSHPAISPDGTRLVYRIRNRLMIRDLAALSDRTVAGGEGGNAPFWSPDGNWLAFGRDARLWKVQASGGEPELLCDLPDRGKLLSGAWSTRNRIAISILWGSVYELSDRGGEVWVRLEPDSTTGSDFQCLQYLPDGETLLAIPHPEQRWAVSGTNMGKIMAIQGSRAWVVLGEDEAIHCHNISFSPSGHLIYARAFNNVGIWAIPFSADRLVPTGEPFLVAANGDRPSVARDGTLTYLPDRPDGEYELVWVDRTGTVQATVGAPVRDLRGPSLSRDGTRVAYSARGDDGRQDIFLRPLAGGAAIRLTYDGVGGSPRWSPDDREIIFHHGMAIYMKPADGGGERRRLFSGNHPMIAPDGRNVIYHGYQEGEDVRDVLVRPVDGSDEPVAVVDGPHEEVGRLSPAGDYLAYQSDESGTDEIYLTRYPGGEGKWQVSAHGGRYVRWVPGGNELIYVDPGDAVMSVMIEREPVLHVTEPVELFSGDLLDELAPDHGFDVAADGRALLMVRRIRQPGDEPSIVVVQNWLAMEP